MNHKIRKMRTTEGAELRVDGVDGDWLRVYCTGGPLLLSPMEARLWAAALNAAADEAQAQKGGSR